MDRRPSVLFVGAFPEPGSEVYGGMVTSCRALLESSLPDKLRLELLDSTQKSNPPPPFVTRLRFATIRFGDFIRRFEARKPDAVLLFVSAGASIVEKSAMAWYARCRGRQAIMFPRAGAVVDSGNASLIYRLFLRLSLRGANTLICQSEAWREFATARLGFSPERVIIIRNWTATPTLLELGASRRQRSTGPVNLVFVGWVERKKGVLDLVESLSHLGNLPEFRLTVIGDGHAMQEARALVERLGLVDRVDFAGWLDPSVVAEMLERADVFVLPSWAEGLPNAMVEAMAAGLTVVASAVGAIPDVVKDRESGMLVAPRDIEGLAAALRQVLDDPQLRVRISREAHRVAIREFGVESAVERIVEVVVSTVGQ